MAAYVLSCAACRFSKREDAYDVECPRCGGLLEVALDEVPREPIDTTQSSIFRYHRLMPYGPLASQAEGARAPETFGVTPIFRSATLSEAIDVDLVLKDETGMPTGTWKDREGYVSIFRLVHSHIADMVLFSSGNSGTSLARAASLTRGPRLHLVVPAASKERLATYAQFFDPRFVVVHFVDGSNDECIVAAKALAKERGFVAEGGFRNYARREGLKLLGLELALDWGEPYDWYVQPVAGGIGIYSLEKAYRDLGRAAECPRILGVQAEACAPMVHAWRDGAPALEARHVPSSVVPSPFVRVLRTRNPHDSYPVVKEVLDRVGGRMEAVSDAEIEAALRLFYREPHFRELYAREQRLVGLEAATALAGIVKARAGGHIAAGATVVLNVSGAAKRGDVALDWAGLVD